MAQRYRRIAEIGRGGMAAVRLAVMSGGAGARKLVAIKELLPDLGSDSDFRTMFLDEARLASRLNHGHVVQTFEVLEEGDSCAIVMEYLEGQPLSRVRSRLKNVAPQALLGVQLRVLIDVLAGLEYAHTLCDFDGTPLRIVHRDISPHNVFVTFSGNAKIVDFGIAKASDSSSQTRTGTLKGKLAYMAPEQARGEPADPRADVFAVGVMLWEAVVGRRIWSGLNDAAILHRLLTSSAPGPRETAPEVPEPLDAVCRKAMEMDRDARFTSAAEMREALEQAVAALGMPLPRPAAIGAMLESAFAEERAKVRAVIDEQIRLQEGVSTAEYDAKAANLVPLPLPSGTGSGMVPGPIEPTGVTSLSVASSVPQAARPHRTLAIAGAAAAVAVAGLVLFLATRNAQGTAGAGSASANAAAPVEPGPRTVHVSLEGVPAGALVTVDGKPLPAGIAVVAGHPGERHAVRVVTPGFEALEFPIDFVDDRAMPITMTALTTPASRPSAHAPPVVAPAHPTATATTKPTSSGIDIGY